MGTVEEALLTRMPTSALLERVEKHIDRLDRALKQSEDLLKSVQSVDRDDWIRRLHERLMAARPTDGGDEGSSRTPTPRRYEQS